jgi:hypothetical protein
MQVFVEETTVDGEVSRPAAGPGTGGALGPRLNGGW